jgi:RNA polymerase sigma factor (sigma-70 family)
MPREAGLKPRHYTSVGQEAGLKPRHYTRTSHYTSAGQVLGVHSRSDMSSELESTFDLIERARRGDQEALDRLFARHLGPLQRWASGRLPRWARGLADTDDLVQDTLLQTFKRIEAFEPRRVGALQAYLRQAVLNRLRDELRRKGRQPPTVDVDAVDLAAGESPLEEAIGREAVERYELALQRLKPEEREAIIARVELGLSYEELADALGKPTPDAARKAAQRALVRLAEELRAAGG